MTKKFVAVAIVLLVIIMSLSACGGSNSIVGTYLGSSGRTILRFEKDGKCTYDQTKSSYTDTNESGTGTYEKQSDGTYKIQVSCLSYELIATVDKNGDLYVTANSYNWSNEFFKKQ